MKIPFPMLLDLVETRMSAEEVGELLTMAGFELEGLDVVEGDPVLDIKVVANRGDGLSAMGLAREILAKDPDSRPTALYEAAVGRFRMSDEATALPTSVSIETPACTRYACRLFDNVENGPSPDWVQQRLRQAGMRPISLLVDLTNYVLLEQGQPLHAFDLDKLSGNRIVVRQARGGERLTTLDGSEHELLPNQMMICDAERPVAAAGIMGGLDTEVTEATKTMLLESAHFVNTSVRKTRKQLGLSTEASYRFERSVDPEGVVAALNRFLLLYQGCTGKDCAPGLIDVYPGKPTPTRLPVRMSRATRLLGMEVTAAEARGYLERLGFAVNGDGEPFTVTAPSWRPDILREDDVIEEIGRVHGYEKIPESAPKGSTPQGGVRGLYHFMDRARETMLRSGFTEIMSHSLRDRHLLDFTDNDRVEVRNPHAPEMALLRNSLLPALAEAALRNGGRDVHLFEIGRVFVKGEIQIDESPELAMLSTGALFPLHFKTPNPSQADFFSIKGTVEELARALEVPVHFDRPLITDPRLHPSRQSSILADHGNLHIGVFGQIHPDVAEELGLPVQTMLAELDLLVLFMERDEGVKLREISRNPAVRRDISVLLDKSVPFADVEAAIRQACGPVLERHWLFDVYEGPNIDPNSRSLAIAMQLRKLGENLTDEEANRIRDAAATALAGLGGRLR